jgi:hypothetical protein
LWRLYGSGSIPALFASTEKEDDLAFMIVRTWNLSKQLRWMSTSWIGRIDVQCILERVIDLCFLRFIFWNWRLGLRLTRLFRHQATSLHNSNNNTTIEHIVAFWSANHHTFEASIFRLFHRFDLPLIDSSATSKTVSLITKNVTRWVEG